MIIGGHSHAVLKEPAVVNGIVIVQAGTGTDQIGRFDLLVNKDTDAIEDYSWKCVPIDSASCPRDRVLENLILNYKNETDRKYSRIIARFARELTHPMRNMETELGDLFADLMKKSLDVDVAFVGSGSIRGEELGPIVSYRDLAEVFPYDDPMYRASVTGGQLRRMIETFMRGGLSGLHREFYQVSDGVEAVFSRSLDRLTSLRLFGHEVGDGLFTVSLQKYHFSNVGNVGDFFGVPIEEISKNGKPKMAATSCLDILEEELIDCGCPSGCVHGRLIFTD